MSTLNYFAPARRFADAHPSRRFAAGIFDTTITGGVGLLALTFTVERGDALLPIAALGLAIGLACLNEAVFPQVGGRVFHVGVRRRADGAAPSLRQRVRRAILTCPTSIVAITGLALYLLQVLPRGEKLADMVLVAVVGATAAVELALAAMGRTRLADRALGLYVAHVPPGTGRCRRTQG